MPDLLPPCLFYQVSQCPVPGIVCALHRCFYHAIAWLFFKRVSLNRCSHVYTPPFSADTFFPSYTNSRLHCHSPSDLGRGQKSIAMMFSFSGCFATRHMIHGTCPHFSFTHGSYVTSSPDYIPIVFLHPLHHLFATRHVCRCSVSVSLGSSTQWFLSFPNTTSSEWNLLRRNLHVKFYLHP